MPPTDFWNPSQENPTPAEVNKVVDAIAPCPREMQKRMDDLRHRKRYIEEKQKARKGVCNYCDHPTPRDFCSTACETRAAFASIGKGLKFHED